jgi:hypothetical protein
MTKTYVPTWVAMTAFVLSGLQVSVDGMPAVVLNAALWFTGLIAIILSAKEQTK